MEKVRVRIDIVGGVAHVVECPDFVALDLRDYDVDECDPHDEGTKADERGDNYLQCGNL